ncbi:MAG: hypothetical protein ACFFD2_00910 [Promethearchaeota archaeon]
MDINEKSELKATIAIETGITGCQLALDLANSGLKIYLVENYSPIVEINTQLNRSTSTFIRAGGGD